MKFTGLLAVVVIPFMMAAHIAYADDNRWKDEGEISFVDTGGNTDVSTLSVKNIMEYNVSERLLSSWKMHMLYGKSDGVKNAENYLTELRLDYSVTDRLYSAALVGWYKDEFAGIRRRYHLGPKVGYKFLVGPASFLFSEAGLNYTTEEYTDDTSNDYLSGNILAKYEYAFTNKNKFSQSLEYIHDFDNSSNYNINSVTALITALNGNLSLKTSYEIKYDNEPVPSTLKKADTILALTLVINIG